MKKLNLFLIIGLVWCANFSQSITSAEYFFDNDPGVGNGTTIMVNSNSGEFTQTYSIPTTGLNKGFHSLYFRTLNDEGNWSLYDRAVLYLAGFPSGQTLLSAEYFFDNDPGVGNGNILVVNSNSGNLTQSYNIQTTGLSEGFHSFYVRAQVTDGTWGLYDRQIIYIKDFTVVGSDIVSAEYFIDSDPGTGNGTSFSISTATQMITFDTDGLADGDHLFYVRVLNQDGEWSFYDHALFTIDPNLGVSENLINQLVVYPNPTDGLINISSSVDITITNTVIYDLTGKTLYQSKQNLHQLDVSSFPSGIYILNLTSDKGSASYKLIKK